MDLTELPCHAVLVDGLPNGAPRRRVAGCRLMRVAIDPVRRADDAAAQASSA